MDGAGASRSGQVARSGPAATLLSQVRKQCLEDGRAIRYVAVVVQADLAMWQADRLANASSPVSDEFEERVVNRTLLTLLQSRGSIDCGGAHAAIVRYGHFWQIIVPVPEGHLSVSLEPHEDPVTTLRVAMDAVESL